MTWTFDLTGGFTPLTHVRFEIGDVNSDRQILQDETINAVIADTGSWQTAVIACIENIIMQLTSQPDFRADWLQVDYRTALEYYQKMLPLKARQLGVPMGQVRANARYIWRPDSNQTSEPTYPPPPSIPDQKLSF